MPFRQILSNFVKFCPSPIQYLLPSDLGRAANGLAEIAGGFPIAQERALVLEHPAAPWMPGWGSQTLREKSLVLGWGDNQCEEYLNGPEVV